MSLKNNNRKMLAWISLIKHLTPTGETRKMWILCKSYNLDDYGLQAAYENTKF